jgi:precorrin-6A/cobalt-precorrin-6A reductase
MAGERVLILGGTGEARRLSEVLVAAGYHTISSLAGVTQAPRLPPGEVRLGGFGGPKGIGAYLKREGIVALLDVAHPFAVRISRHAARAACDTGVPIARLQRPAWSPVGGETWIDVASVAQAAEVLPAGARDIKGILRMIEPPELAVPEGWHLVLERPPFTVETESQTIQKYRISHLVSKNSGGPETEAKLIAARQLKIPIIVVARPAKPRVPQFSSHDEILQWLRATLSP